MARKRFEELTGLTEIQAAIYKEDNLPSAVIADKDGDQPFTLHSLREEGLQFFEEHFINRMISAQGIERKDVDQLKVRLYKFFENYENQTAPCYGSALSDNIQQFYIKDAEHFATKLCEDCA